MIDLWKAPFYTYYNAGGFMFNTYKPRLPKEVSDWLDENSAGWKQIAEDIFEDDWRDPMPSNTLIMNEDMEAAFILKFMSGDKNVKTK